WQRPRRELPVARAVRRRLSVLRDDPQLRRARARRGRSRVRVSSGGPAAVRGDARVPRRGRGRRASARRATRRAASFPRCVPGGHPGLLAIRGIQDGEELAMARCSICYTVIKESEAHTACPDCQTDYHSTCWKEIGGCGTYGCKKAAVAEKPAVPVLVGQGWG